MERISEGGGANYFYLFASEGVGECQSAGMQIHPLCWGVAIERVAKYRVIQSVRVCTMYAQLVCSACERVEQHSVLTHKSILGYRLLAFLVIHPLHGTMLEVGGEGEAYS